MTQRMKTVNKRKRSRSLTPERLPGEPTEVEERPSSIDIDVKQEVDFVLGEYDSLIYTSDVSDYSSPTHTAGITPSKYKSRKPKSKIARTLRNEEEDEVIEWLKSNRFLYDKSSYEFKNREMKERTWLEMDQKMRLNPGDIFRWYTSLRTQFVKEVKRRETATRSGAGAVDDIVTPRLTWLMEKFEFVRPYVCKSRATRGSTIHKPRKHSCSSEASFLPQDIPESTPQSSTPGTTATVSDYLETVSHQNVVSKNEIEKTCDFLSVLMAKMTPSCLEDFTNEAICKAMEYVKQSNQERRRTRQPPKGYVSQTPLSPAASTEELQQFGTFHLKSQHR